MPTLARRARLAIVVSAVLLAGGVASAGELPAAAEPLLRDLKGASPAAYQQVADAISSSSLLQRQLEELVASNRLTALVVLPRAQVRDGRVGLFGGFTNGPALVLTTEFLAALKQRNVHVVRDGDIPADNTVFALAHLLHHVANPLDPQRYPSPDAFAAAALRIEATAFVHAWNAMLQSAEKRNGDKPLAPGQVGGQLLDARYRFAFPADALKFSPAGYLEADEQTTQAIIARLRQSRLPDMQ